MTLRLGQGMLITVALIAIFTAIAHTACLFLGPTCYRYQMAPESVVISAQNGTLFAPIATILVSSVFLIWAAYALSGAQMIRRLPLLSIGVYTISMLCIARGLLGIQLWLRRPELVTEFANISSWIWFLTGMLFLAGYRIVKKIRCETNNDR